MSGEVVDFRGECRQARSFFRGFLTENVRNSLLNPEDSFKCPHSTQLHLFCLVFTRFEATLFDIDINFTTTVGSWQATYTSSQPCSRHTVHQRSVKSSTGQRQRRPSENKDITSGNDSRGPVTTGLGVSCVPTCSQPFVARCEFTMIHESLLNTMFDTRRLVTLSCRHCGSLGT